jgi:hypothetical protein
MHFNLKKKLNRCSKHIFAFRTLEVSESSFKISLPPHQIIPRDNLRIPRAEINVNLRIQLSKILQLHERFNGNRDD